jgi:Mn2+/Fe2+ NRAMP family transporter
MTLPKYRVMVFFISLLGLIVPLLGARPVLVMIASQAFNAVILPITVACIFYLANRKDLMGSYKNGLMSNLILIAILLFSLFTSFIGVKGVLQMIAS